MRSSTAVLMAFLTNNDAFGKLEMTEGVLGALSGDNLGISEVDVNRYWQQIQKESMVDPVKDMESGGDAMAVNLPTTASLVGGGGEAEEQAAQAAAAPQAQQLA